MVTGTELPEGSIPAKMHAACSARLHPNVQFTLHLALPLVDCQAGPLLFCQKRNHIKNGLNVDEIAHNVVADEKATTGQPDVSCLAMSG